MKFTIPILFLLFCLSYSSYGQTTKEAQSIFKNISIKETITIKLDGKAYDLAVLENLKTDLLMYHEKILSVSINPTSKAMDITYNGFMQRYDFENAFIKNDISFYHKDVSNSTVIQDKQ